MSNQIFISLIVPIKLVIIYFIFSYFKKRRLRNIQKSNEAIERIQIREYGRKINDETRNKKNK
ncbi:hypothetical protein [Candidatus Pelagibacter communis]|uniref:hypothetical protein n=1 Tax=Pelagibacter ubique TaxID=198252 RepID=UPI00065B3624|nr:hypothetical protein [Candidatus Pelagibacter ubique]